MIKLSSRERIMLGTLLLLIVFGMGTFYWILPMRSEIDILTESITELEIQQREMRSIIARADSLGEDNDQLTDEIKELMDFLTKPFLVEEFDLTLASLANRNVVNVQSVSYGGIQITTPSATETVSQRFESNLSSLLYALFGIESETTTRLESDSQILKQTININVQGTFTHIQDFLGELSNLGPTYFVNSVSYSRSESSNEEGIQVNETATITLDVYFLLNETTNQNDTE